MSTIDTTGGQAYLGDGGYFSQPPLDFAETDQGFCGAQHKLLLKTPGGHLTIDAKRGQVFLLKGNGLEEISARGMRQFFANHLSFRIKERFSDIDTDNAFAGIGLSGVYDSRYHRFIITKKDFEPLDSAINHSKGRFYLDGKEIRLDDQQYFCNRSWTLSYSMLLQRWISFHSYVPGFYIAHPASFETGTGSEIYLHNRSLKFNRVNGELTDYIIEYPVITGIEEEIISAVSSRTAVLQYTSDAVFYEPTEDIFYNEAVIYNNSQCSGRLLLYPKPAGNLAAYRRYPILKTDSKEILFTRKDGICSFNTFWDIVADKSKPFYSTPCSIVSLDKSFDHNLDYGVRSYHKVPLRARDSRVRLIYNGSDSYKLLTTFLITETTKSIT